LEDPVAFSRKWEKEQEKLREKIINARKLLPRVSIDDKQLFIIAELCTSLKVDGHRPDIVIAITAKTIAAYKGREFVVEEDILQAAKLALGHRTREMGLLEPPSYEEIEKAFRDAVKKAEKFFREN